MVLNYLQGFWSKWKITAKRARSREPIKEKPNWEQRERRVIHTKTSSNSMLKPELLQTSNNGTIIHVNQPANNASQYTCKNLAGYRTNIWKISYGGTLYLAEVFHFVQHFVYFWNNILPIYKYWHIGTISQSNMKHSSVLEQEGKKLMKLFPN